MKSVRKGIFSAIVAVTLHASVPAMADRATIIQSGHEMSSRLTAVAGQQLGPTRR